MVPSLPLPSITKGEYVILPARMVSSGNSSSIAVTSESPQLPVLCWLLRLVELTPPPSRAVSTDSWHKEKTTCTVRSGKVQGSQRIYWSMLKCFISNETIEYDILREEPTRFKKINRIRIIHNIRYPLIKTMSNTKRAHSVHVCTYF